jgi:CheY-like chemotaxis protein
VQEADLPQEKETRTMARILVIDDDDQVREMLRQMMELAGHEVAVAANGEIGMRTYREQPADLIVTDIIMPEKDGWEAIVELRKEFPDVKIVAISGGARLGPYSYLAIAKRFGAQRVFAKPVEKAELLKAITELLGSSAK